MEPTLVILAAGMGSRFGGLKQMEPVDREGHSIIDFSMYDARRAGFRDLVFIIKREHEALFRERIGTRMERFFHVEYVYQELTDIPAGCEVPEGRIKPWGTGQAVACCRNVLHGPFAVINSDDFYGRTAFSEIYEFLRTNEDPHQYAMVGPAEAAAHPGGHDHKLRCILIHKTASYPAILAVHKNSIFCACTSTRAGTPNGTMQRGSAWPTFSPHTTV